MPQRCSRVQVKQQFVLSTSYKQLLFAAGYRKMRLFACCTLLLLNMGNSVGFLSSKTVMFVGRQRQRGVQPLFVIEDVPLLGEECGGVSEDSTSIFQALKERQNEIDNGIGKIYICRTQKGFLNVHKEPGEPFNPYNILNHLSEGDIITSISPPRGGWIHHDSGWSIAIYNGFTWLEELKE